MKIRNIFKTEGQIKITAELNQPKKISFSKKKKTIENLSKLTSIIKPCKIINML